MEREDGEMSDDNAMLLDVDSEEITNPKNDQNKRTVVRLILCTLRKTISCFNNDNLKELLAAFISICFNTFQLYKAEKDGVVIKQLEKVDAAKLEERANSIGLNLTGNRIITQNQIDELYANFGVEGNERHFRFDAIYLNGIEGLTTREIFEYLEDYKPSSLEWIDEVSCKSFV